MKSPGPHELAELLSRTALRNQVAYEALYRATAAKLFGLALRILRKRELAEDCLQDAFVSIWYRAGDSRLDRAQPFTWMAAIVRNRALDMLRATPTYREVAGGDQLDDWAVERSNPLEDAAASDEARALLRSFPPSTGKPLRCPTFGVSLMRNSRKISPSRWER